MIAEIVLLSIIMYLNVMELMTVKMEMMNLIAVSLHTKNLTVFCILIAQMWTLKAKTNPIPT